jgi:serine/threonine protein kinase
MNPNKYSEDFYEEETVVNPVSRRTKVQPSLPPPEEFKHFQIGQYTIVQEIARGGMGIIYKGYQKGLDRPVALKMLLAGDQASATQKKRFLREAQASARLAHPNIVPVHEIGIYQEQIYYSMDFIKGETLEQKLEKKTVTIRQGVKYLSAVLSAMDYAHREGIIHRDLKPANIIIDQHDNPRIMDFGLARISESSVLTMDGSMVGTVEYMSPEQAEGRSDLIDARSDIFSIGSILYAILTGKSPFKSDSILTTAMQVVQGEPPLPSKINSEVSSVLEKICCKALAKNREERFQSAREMQVAIDAYLDGKTPAPTSPSTVTARPQSIKRPGGTKQWLLLGLMFLVIGVGAGAWLAWHFFKPAPPLVLGVYSYLSDEEMTKIYKPLGERLAKYCHRRLRVEFSENPSILLKNLGDGQLDLGILSPVPYLELIEQYPEAVVKIARIRKNEQIFYRPYIIGNRNALLQYAREHTKDSAMIWETLAEKLRLADFSPIEGARFAFVSRNSSSSFRLPYLYFAERGINLNSFFAVDHAPLKNHKEVIDQVAAGKFPLGGTYDGAFKVYNVEEDPKYAAIEVLVRMLPIPNDVMVARRSMSAEEISDIKSALEMLYIPSNMTGHTSYEFDLRIDDTDMKNFRWYLESGLITGIDPQGLLLLDQGLKDGFRVGTAVTFFRFADYRVDEEGRLIDLIEQTVGQGVVVDAVKDRAKCQSSSGTGLTTGLRVKLSKKE